MAAIDPAGSIVNIRVTSRITIDRLVVVVGILIVLGSAKLVKKPGALAVHKLT
jgi:hypothetical protein